MIFVLGFWVEKGIYWWIHKYLAISYFYSGPTTKAQEKSGHLETILNIVQML